MSTGHPDCPPAARADFGPLLATLQQEHVRFVVVGPAAARARCTDLSSVSRAAGPSLDITPEPTPSNLRLLAVALSAALDARLHTADALHGLPIRLSAGIFSAIPILPLTTSLGPLNVLSQPPSTYRDLLTVTTATTGSDGIATLTAAVEAHPSCLEAGITSINPDLLRVLPLANESAAMAATRPNGFEHKAVREGDLEDLVLSALAEADTPMSIRDILSLTPLEKKAPYKRLKAAAETLTRRGQLLRGKSGTAHRYRLHTDTDTDTDADTEIETDDSVVHRIRALLAERDDPQAIVQAALLLSSPWEQR